LNESVDRAGLETVAEENDAMIDFFGVLGGLVVVLAFQLTFFLSGNIANWIAVSAISDHSIYVTFMEVFGPPILIILECGFIAVGLMITFWLLPVSSEYMNKSLMRAAGLTLISAGLTLISFPLLPIGGYGLAGVGRRYFFGYDLNYWFVFPVIGLVFLFLPELKNRWHLSGSRAWVFPVAAVFLGLLSSVLFLQGWYGLPSVESSGENYPTPFSLLGLTAGLVILVHSVLMPFVPKEFGIKSKE
jgi:hypothetical protein